jgi:hypothetical protein
LGVFFLIFDLKNNTFPPQAEQKKEKPHQTLPVLTVDLRQITTKKCQETAICRQNPTMKRVKSVIIWVKNRSKWGIFTPLKKKLSTIYFLF